MLYGILITLVLLFGHVLNVSFTTVTKAICVGTCGAIVGGITSGAVSIVRCRPEPFVWFVVEVSSGAAAGCAAAVTCYSMPRSHSLLNIGATTSVGIASHRLGDMHFKSVVSRLQGAPLDNLLVASSVIAGGVVGCLGRKVFLRRSSKYTLIRENTSILAKISGRLKRCSQ